MGSLSHFDDTGASRMVDVGAKPVTTRAACACGWVQLAPATVRVVRDRGVAKGDVLEVARLAGIMGAKQTAQLIPLCHPLSLDSVKVDLEIVGDRRIFIRATVQVTARTGVEMEALVAVQVAALTIYDMCKAVDREIVIGPAYLEEKTGGRSGRFVRTAAPPELRTSEDESGESN